jgi:hypothetical protein
MCSLTQCSSAWADFDTMVADTPTCIYRPDGCTFSGTTVDCSSQSLTAVPSVGIPSGIHQDTTILYMFISWDKLFSLTARCFLCDAICRFLL